MGPREEQRGPDLPPGRWGAAGGAELGRATQRASRCLALCCRLPSLAWLQPRGGHEGGGRG